MFAVTFAALAVATFAVTLAVEATHMLTFAVVFAALAVAAFAVAFPALAALWVNMRSWCRSNQQSDVIGIQYAHSVCSCTAITRSLCN